MLKYIYESGLGEINEIQVQGTSHRRAEKYRTASQHVCSRIDNLGLKSGPGGLHDLRVYWAVCNCRVGGTKIIRDTWSKTGNV